MKLTRLFLAVGLILAGPALAQDAFTTDDLLRIEDLSQPVFSPDGSTITYVVTGPGDGDTSQSDLWTVSWQGGDAHAVQATLDRDEWAPAYSADGRVFAFIRSGWEEPAQLWVSKDGEPARKITNIVGGVDAFTLSPDGRSAVVQSEVGANVGEEAGTPPPIVIDRLTVKEDGRGWLDDRRVQLLRVDIAGTEDEPVTSAEAVPITSGDFDSSAPAWSPDGKWIAFVSSRCANADAHYCSDIYLVAPGGGTARRISTYEGADSEPSFSAGGPQWSPDSRHLVWVRAGDERHIWYTPHQIVTADIDRDGRAGAERQLAWIDRWTFFPRWSADGKSVLALIEQDRETWLARVDAASGAVEYLTGGKSMAYDFAEARDGRLAVLDGSSEVPTQLRSVEPSPRVLSVQNQWVAGRRLAATQDVAFMSDGIEIHGQLMLPPGHKQGQRHPLIARLHGGPVYQFSHEFMSDWQVLAAQGYAVLAINPRGSSGRGVDFAQAQMARWGTVDVDDIKAGISHVLAMGVADPDRIGVGGWSYGGILSDYMIASDPRIKAAVSGAGMANFLGGYGVDQYAREYELELGRPWENTEAWLKLSYPFYHPERISAATLFLCGDVDWNVPCTGGQQLYTALKSLGVPTRLVVYPDQTHGLNVPSYIRDRMDRTVAWYDFYLRGKGKDPLAK